MIFSARARKRSSPSTVNDSIVLTCDKKCILISVVGLVCKPDYSVKYLSYIVTTLQERRL